MTDVSKKLHFTMDAFQYSDSPLLTGVCNARSVLHIGDVEFFVDFSASDQMSATFTALQLREFLNVINDALLKAQVTAMKRLDMTFFALWPRRESYLTPPSVNAVSRWIKTGRWLWMCRVRRIRTVWGETFYMRADA